MPERAVTLPNGCEQHGVPAYRDDAGTVHIATGARCVGPDAERDERVRLRRAADARRAGRALDALLGTAHVPTGTEFYRAGWDDGYAAAQDGNSE